MSYNFRSPVAALVGALALSVCCLAHAQRADSFAEATAQADEAAQSGEPGLAADLLAPWAERYADDFSLQMQVASFYFKDHRNEEALEHYRRAHALANGESREAQLGVAYALLALDRKAEAQIELDQVLVQEPNDREARAALAPRPPPAQPGNFTSWGWVLGGYQHYSGHPYKPQSNSFSAGMLVSIQRLLLLSASYRLLNYQFAHYDALFQLQAPETERQQEGYLFAGIALERFALRGHYGHVSDESNPLVPAHIFGASASLWWWLSADAEVSVTHFEDEDVLRAALGGLLPIGAGFSGGPIASLQHMNDVISSFGGRIRWATELLTLSVEARFGEERRPTYLLDSLSFASNDRIRSQVMPRVDWRVSPYFDLTGSYTWQRLNVTSYPADVEANAHFFNLALVAHSATRLSSSTAR